MTREEREEAIKVIQNFPIESTEERKAVLMAVQALEQEPCGDAISRQAVLYGLASIAKAKAKSDAQKSLMGRVMFFVEQLPPVTPQPKTGHWEWVQYDYNPKLGNWHCSECRSVVIECVDKNDKGGIPLYKYCPQCGAKMIEPQERSDKE